MINIREAALNSTSRYQGFRRLSFLFVLPTPPGFRRSLLRSQAPFQLLWLAEAARLKVVCGRNQFA